MLRLDKPEDRSFTLRLEDEGDEICLMADDTFLLVIDKKTHEIARVPNVGASLGFELDESGRVVVK